MGQGHIWTIDFWRELLSNDFNAGYMTGAGMAVLFLLLVIVLRLIISFIFRTRRCSSIQVQGPGGVLTISREAVRKAAHKVLEPVDELDVRRIQLYRKRKRYSLLLYCNFCSGGRGLPAVSDQVRPQIIETLRKLFGIESLTKVNFVVEEFEGENQPETPAPELPSHEINPGF